MDEDTAGFLDSPSGKNAGGADKEQEIAENIFDWWISGKSYEKWYADLFPHVKIRKDAKAKQKWSTTITDQKTMTPTRTHTR